MTESNTSEASVEQASQKEINFRKQEMMFQRQLEQERNARIQAEKEAQKLKSRMSKNQEYEEEDDSEPYVDHKKLNKKLNSFGQKYKQETQSEINRAVQMALEKERQENWLNQNRDYEEIMKHADKLYEHDPELAETILKMPDSFERHKLVYRNIKSLGLHKPKENKSSIQDTINANQRSPGYQPGSIGTPAYSPPQGDFSPKGQKESYDKMQELKGRLRIS